MSPTDDAIRDLILPVASELGLEIYDIDMASGTLRILLDKAGGIDMGSITEATRRISRSLDSADPIAGSYTLEVSSPGIERVLRVPEHFSGAIGERLKIKTRANADMQRRIGGTLESFEGTIARVRTDEGQLVEVALDQIERARTEFVETTAPKPGKGPRPKNKSRSDKDAESKSKTRRD